MFSLNFVKNVKINNVFLVKLVLDALIAPPMTLKLVIIVKINKRDVITLNVDPKNVVYAQINNLRDVINV